MNKRKEPIIRYELEESRHAGNVNAGFRIYMPDGTLRQFKNPFPAELEIGKVFDMIQQRAELELHLDTIQPEREQK